MGGQVPSAKEPWPLALGQNTETQGCGRTEMAGLAIKPSNLPIFWPSSPTSRRCKIKALLLKYLLHNHLWWQNEKAENNMNIQPQRTLNV